MGGPGCELNTTSRPSGCQGQAGTPTVAPLGRQQPGAFWVKVAWAYQHQSCGGHRGLSTEVSPTLVLV